jgi:hypothetical protein
MERLRVNAGADGPVVVAKSALQYKGDRDYFRATIAMGMDQLYISPMELNIEHGRVERPFKPVIRFALPVPDADGHPAGVLVINHRAVDMLHRYRQVATPGNGEAMLLNEGGYWLSHPDPEQAWGFMFSDRVGETMAVADPEAWVRISAAGSGQFYARGALFSFATVRPFAAFKQAGQLVVSRQHLQRLWKVVSRYPAAMLEAVAVSIRYLVIWTSVLVWLMTSLLLFLRCGRA